MSFKHVIGGIVIAAGVAGCSNNPSTIKENTEDIKDSISNTTDTINKSLIEIIDEDTHDKIQMKRRAKYRKVNLLEGTNRTNSEAIDTISKKRRVEDVIKAHESWIEDGDNMRKYINRNNDEDYYTKSSLSRDYKEYEEQGITDYNPDEDEIFVRKFK